MDYMWILVLLALGLMMLIKPRILWKIEHFLSVKDGEPTDFYLIGMRIGGTFFTLCALGVLIYVIASR